MDAVENGPPGRVIPRPPRWKTAVTVWLGMFPMLAVLNVTMVPRLRRLPCWCVLSHCPWLSWSG
jgi:antibiotic biosynthesis monooxygenase (ABM) superfamily enzyme